MNNAVRSKLLDGVSGGLLSSKISLSLSFLDMDPFCFCGLTLTLRVFFSQIVWSTLTRLYPGVSYLLLHNKFHRNIAT